MAGLGLAISHLLREEEPGWDPAPGIADDTIFQLTTPPLCDISQFEIEHM
jgi:hypothetical protein